MPGSPFSDFAQLVIRQPRDDADNVTAEVDRCIEVVNQIWPPTHGAERNA
jgi:hypothetical protein